MAELNEEMAKQKEALEKVTNATYATVTAGLTASTTTVGPNTVGETLHSVVITSTDQEETGDKVLERVRKVVDAKEGWIEVKKVRKAKDRKVIIGLKTKEEREKLKKRLERENATLQVEEVKNRDPLLILRGVLVVHTDEDIHKALRNQNRDLFANLKEGDDRVEIRYRRKTRNPHTCHMVLSSPAIWQRAINKKKAHIDLQTVRIEDQTPLVECTRCLGFGHGKRFCTEPADLCSHCGGPL